MTGKIPYYYVTPKNGRAYWRPNKRMMTLGFRCVALGDAGEAAEEQARAWNAKWQIARKQDPSALGIRADQERRAARQYVYFLQVSDRVKIGTSSKPLRRIQDITASLPAPARRIVIVEGTVTDERRLHERFKAYRTGGEWFVATRPVALAIGRCASAGMVVHDGNEEGAKSRSIGNFESKRDELSA
uniref:Bacteriophage T5 Orf172 DNA-binding domain-containing protein n=1 Tax=Rhodopseudomonas palustris (strain DX-1) TaxID=652103 RepID=E6VFI6_RHOPX